MSPLFFIIILVALVLVAQSTRGLRSSRPHPQLSYYPDEHYQQSQWTPPVDPAAAIRATDEDITTFGDELRALDLEVVGKALDEATQQDYQRALDAYEFAKESLAKVRTAQEVQHVTSILEDGRYAIACVKARVEGKPLPVKRPPCFFNPAHGPSSQNVMWAPPGGTPREIPACPADAERVLAGADPYIRTVAVGPARVPYWQESAYAPYAQGYYNNWQTDRVVQGLVAGTAVFAGLAVLPHLLEGLGDALEDIFDEFD